MIITIESFAPVCCHPRVVTNPFDLQWNSVYVIIGVISGLSVLYDCDACGLHDYITNKTI